MSKQNRNTIKGFATAVAALGASIDQASLSADAYNVDAPPGMIWAGTGTHTLTASFSNAPGQRWQSAAIRDLLVRIDCGLEACGDPECDVCAEARDAS